MSKCIFRPIGNAEKIVVYRPNLYIYYLLLLTDHKQCFGINVLSRIQSYRQPVACTPCLWTDRRITLVTPLTLSCILVEVFAMICAVLLQNQAQGSVVL